MDKTDTEKKPESLVYSREEYAKKEFWDDRFKESKGFFDWYANWKEIGPSFGAHIDQFSCDQILMVGCGNSRMSEEMALSHEKYRNMTNLDVSSVVLDKMKAHQDKIPAC